MLVKNDVPPTEGEFIPHIPSKAQDMIAFFFHEFCTYYRQRPWCGCKVTPAETCNRPGWMARLPEQYYGAPENACYRPALLAASYAILAKKRDEASYQYTARAIYVSALEATSQTLRNCYDDSTHASHITA
ncbi:hypothetical protein BDZ45DRAFT_750335 [Acephala macrosclerotiorum]|nr:hypothetical protein BDZ45DRAFT_750335 [Acephala macrosclerotiorum]